MTEVKTSQEIVTLDIDPRGVATITLNRPEMHNVFNDEVILLLTRLFTEAGADKKVRAVVLASTGASFSAGAELNWMKKAATYTYEENLVDARRIAEMMDVIYRLQKPTIALVQGPAYGGGVGLVSCCDIVIAVSNATFSLSEIKLGIIPATISPYVMAAIGPRQARRYFQTAERFDGVTAQRIGLVSELVGSADDLSASAERMIKYIMQAGPEAVKAAKNLVLDLGHLPPGPEVMDETAKRIADLRKTPEAQEGLSAFLEKRKPNWI